jgi:hypothetical protein
MHTNDVLQYAVNIPRVEIFVIIVVCSLVLVQPRSAHCQNYAHR